MNQEHIVALCWATKKRHIAVDGHILCSAESKSGGFSSKNGSYNGLALSGIPTYCKMHDDTKFGHAGGIIDYKPLNAQSTLIIETSICKKCLVKYQKLF